MDTNPTTPRPTGRIRGAWATFCIGLGLALFAGAWIELGEANGLRGAHMLRDPAAIFDFHVMVGAISTLGVATLVFTAGMLVIAASLNVPDRRLFAAVAGFSVLLAVDDQFLLHERVMPNAFGIQEEAVMAVYALMGLLILVSAYRRLGGSGLKPLIPALGFLMVSVLLDVDPFDLEPSYAAEDLTKLAGFGAWAAFWGMTAWGQCHALSAADPGAK